MSARVARNYSHARAQTLARRRAADRSRSDLSPVVPAVAPERLQLASFARSERAITTSEVIVRCSSIVTNRLGTFTAQAEHRAPPPASRAMAQVGDSVCVARLGSGVFSKVRDARGKDNFFMIFLYVEFTPYHLLGENLVLAYHSFKQFHSWAIL